jgi:hypothetical protein
MLWSAAVTVLLHVFVQQAGEDAEAATADLVQNLSQQISTALQPSLATIQRMVQAVVPVLQAGTSGRDAAAPQPDAQSTQAQRGAAAPQPSSQPALASPAAEVARDHRASRLPLQHLQQCKCQSHIPHVLVKVGCRPWLGTVVHQPQQLHQLARTVANSSGHTYQRPQCRQRSQWSLWTPQVRSR